MTVEERADADRENERLDDEMSNAPTISYEEWTRRNEQREEQMARWLAEADEEHPILPAVFGFWIQANTFGKSSLETLGSKVSNAHLIIQLV